MPTKESTLQGFTSKYTRETLVVGLSFCSPKAPTTWKAWKASDIPPTPLKDSYPVRVPSNPFCFFPPPLVVLVFIGGFLKLEGKEWKVHVSYLLPFLLKLVCVIVSWFKRHRWRLLQGRKNKTHPTPLPLQSFTGCVARGFDGLWWWRHLPDANPNTSTTKVKSKLNCVVALRFYIWWFCIDVFVLDLVHFEEKSRICTRLCS